MDQHDTLAGTRAARQQQGELATALALVAAAAPRPIVARVTVTATLAAADRTVDQLREQLTSWWAVPSHPYTRLLDRLLDRAERHASALAQNPPV